MMTLKEIEKRKPEKASAEFWGGEKDKWEKGKKVGTEKVEGWYDKMVWKTVYRAAHNDITIDSQKIDDDYLRLKQIESDLSDAEVSEEIRANANRDVIDVTPQHLDDVPNDNQPSGDGQPEMEFGDPEDGKSDKAPF
jgi:recombination protein RecT